MEQRLHYLFRRDIRKYWNRAQSELFPAFSQGVGEVQVMKSQGFTKFELGMGLAVISIAVLLMFPPLQGGVDKDQAMRAWEKAESIAWAVNDYHQDTGKWPQMRDGSMDLACLTRPNQGLGYSKASETTLAGSLGSENGMAMFGTMGQNGLTGIPEAGSRPWLQEIPLDSWDHPFNIWILDQEIQSGMQTVVVISGGPDGVLQTDPTAWPAKELAAAAALCRTGPALVPEGFFLGDDMGFILAQAQVSPPPGGTQ